MGGSHSNNNEEDPEIARRRAEEEAAAAKAAAAAARKLHAQMLKSANITEKDSPYVQILLDEYANNDTAQNLASFNEAKEVDKIASQTLPCNTDEDIFDIMKQTSHMLNDETKRNSTKVYFISEVINKALGHFDKKNYNELLPKVQQTMNDDKYKKIIALITLAENSKNITSTALSPNNDKFMAISNNIIKESKIITDNFKPSPKSNEPTSKSISAIQPANINEQEKHKYEIIVI